MLICIAKRIGLLSAVLCRGERIADEGIVKRNIFVDLQVCFLLSIDKLRFCDIIRL
jgi:hypothetical protein